jgi:hypothetical protein
MNGKRFIVTDELFCWCAKSQSALSNLSAVGDKPFNDARR